MEWLRLEVEERDPIFDRGSEGTALRGVVLTLLSLGDDGGTVGLISSLGSTIS